MSTSKQRQSLTQAKPGALKKMRRLVAGAYVTKEELTMPGGDKAIRHNQGKLRYDLVSPWAHEGMVSVMTKVVERGKYEPRNWEKGLPFTNILASLKRHIAAIEKGEDIDLEDGELHADHAACNIHFLSHYMRWNRDMDDRPKYIVAGVETTTRKNK